MFVFVVANKILQELVLLCYSSRNIRLHKLFYTLLYPDDKIKTSQMADSIIGRFMVEMTGVEPVSESRISMLSPSAADRFKFPS